VDRGELRDNLLLTESADEALRMLLIWRHKNPDDDVTDLIQEIDPQGTYALALRIERQERAEEKGRTIRATKTNSRLMRGARQVLRDPERRKEAFTSLTQEELEAIVYDAQAAMEELWGDFSQ
jgi:hypothetical protein